MKVIALYNLKGGVGKTAASVNLAYQSAQHGFRTLLWDLDPQGASSFYFRIKPKLKGGLSKLFVRDNQLDNLIKGTDFTNLDLLPSDFSLRKFDIFIASDQKLKRKIKKRLKLLDEDYDFVFVDCPPQITISTELILELADIILVPVVPTILSERSLLQMVKFFKKQSVSLSKIMPFFSMVDQRKSLHRQIMNELPEPFPGFFKTQIPLASVVEKMGVERAPVAVFAATTKANHAFLKLWLEMEGKL